MNPIEFFRGNPQERELLKRRDQLRSQLASNPKASRKLAAMEGQAQGITRRLAIRRIGAGGLLTAAAASPVVWSLIADNHGNYDSRAVTTRERQPRSFKDRVLSFGWDQAEGRELRGFTSDLADEYLRLTRTDRITRADLVDPRKINYFSSREEMLREIGIIEPNFSIGQTQYGYANFESGRIFLDLSTLRDQVTSSATMLSKLDPNKTAGMALLDAIWHEAGHVDVKARDQGEWLNNPKFFFHSPKSNRDEQFRRYRGVEVFTDTYFGFLWFEEVLNETITFRRMTEQVGLERVISAKDYYQNGVDFFSLFTSSAGISLKDLYQLHATSDFEGLIKLLGSKLPGNRPADEKGMDLAVAIHQSNPQLIQQTGVYNLLPKR